VSGGGSRDGRRRGVGIDELGDNERICLCDALDRTADAENTLVHSLCDFADTGFDTSLFTEVSDIFTAFPYNDTCILRAHESTKGKYVTPGRGRGSGIMRRGGSTGMIWGVGRHGREREKGAKRG